MFRKIVLVAAVCFVYSPTTVHGVTEADVHKMGETCKKEVNATDSDLQAVMNVTTPMTKMQGCITNCLFKKFKIIDANNKINSTAFLDVFGDSAEESAESEEVVELMAAMKGCANSYSDKDECIAAKKYIECISDKLKE